MSKIWVAKSVPITEATEAHFFPQESSSAHRFAVGFPKDQVQLTDLQFMNSNPMSQTRFLCKKTSLCHPVQEKTTLWVHPLKNDNVGSAQLT